MSSASTARISNPAAPLLPQTILDASHPTSSTSTPASSSTQAVDTSSLSSRGQRACQPTASYFSKFFKALGDAWSADNRDGYVLMCVAENKLNWQMWADRVQDPAHRQLDHDTGAYADCTGRQPLRQQLAQLMNRRFSSSPTSRIDIQPDQICIGNGVGPTLAMLVALLVEAGDGILIPAPMYAAFPNDLSILAGAIPVPVRTEAADYRLTVQAFEAARQHFDSQAAHASSESHQHNEDGLAKSATNGQHKPASITTDSEDSNSIHLYKQQLDRTHHTNNRRIKAVLITNPNNPLGCIYERDEVEAIMSWAAQHKLHVIIDEIYANSIYDPMPRPNYSSSSDTTQQPQSPPSPFYSALHYLSNPPPSPLTSSSHQLPPPTHLHVLHGLSKDFGLSGYRIGWLVTGNSAVRTAWSGNVGYFTGVSNDVQCLIERVLRDGEWVDRYLYRCCELLAGSYRTLVRLLDGSHEALAEQQAGGQESADFVIPHLPARAGMFAFVDLRQFLQPPSRSTGNSSSGGEGGNDWTREEELMDVLVDEARVLLTPGHSQLTNEPGWFRLCFGWVVEEALIDGMKRMRRTLYKRRQHGGSGHLRQQNVGENGTAD